MHKLMRFSSVANQRKANSHLLSALRWLITALVLNCLLASTLQADPSDTFLKAYMAVQTGDRLEEEGKLADALSKYRVAAELLDEISRENPEWQPHVLQYRKRKTSEGIARLTAKLGDAAPPSQPALPFESSYGLEPPLPAEGLTTGAPSLTVDPSLASPYNPTIGQSTGEVLDAATREIRNRILQLETELNSARSRATAIEQERTQLARQLAATDAQLKEALRKLDQSQLTQAELKSQLEQVTEALKNAAMAEPRIEQYEKEISNLKNELEAVKAERDLAQDENLDLAMQIARQQAITARISAEREKILAERDAALSEVATAAKAREESERLLAENSDLIKKVAEAEQRIRELQEQPRESEELLALRDQVEDLREQLTMAQTQRQEAQVQLSNLESELRAVSEKLATQNQRSEDPEETRRLAAENEVLRQIIQRELQAQARREQARDLVREELARLQIESASLTEQIDLLGQPVMKLTEQEAELLRAGSVNLVEAAPPAGPGNSEQPTTETPSDEPLPEAEAISLEASAQKPASPPKENQAQPPSEPSTGSQTVEGELAVEKPDADAAEDSTDKKPTVPPKFEAIAREAREFFERGQYPEAEELYQKILAEEPDNLYALSNLGVTQFRSGRLKAAEKSFKKATAINPRDSFSLATLGIVYYRQGRLDDAIDVLTRAIAINPKDAVAHNYLGITASQKGWQEAAEKELQSAIAINPNYADAHFNLAVVYAIAQPPSLEMARKHYKRATELGADPDPGLERLIE